MRPMIWKELRESLAVAVVGALTLLVALIATVWEGVRGRTSDVNEAFASEPVAIVTTCGFALLAMAVAVRQTFFERRGDSWAFLVHRPLSVSRIFLAKAIAGITMLLLATLVPYLAMAAWIALPGHAAGPFYWQLAAFGVAAALMSLGYYFAAVLVVMRDARWYASRLLPLGPAVAGSLIVLESPTWAYAAAAIALIVSCLGLAAWGMFVRCGELSRQPIAARACFAITLAASVSVVWLGLTALYRSQFDDRGGVPDVRYAIDRDGRVWRYQTNAAGTTTLVDDPTPARPAPTAFRWEDHLAMTRVDLGTHEQRHRWWTVDGYFRALQHTGGTRWFYSFVEGKILGFEFRHLAFPIPRPRGWTRTVAMGPRDAIPTTPGAPASFTSRLTSADNAVLRFEDAAYWFDSHRRQLHKLADSTRDDPVVGGQMLTHARDRMMIMVATHRHVLLFAIDDHLPVKIADLPAPDTATAEWVRLGDLPSRGSYMLLLGQRDGNQLAVEMTSHGEIMRRLELAIPPDLRRILPYPGMLTHLGLSPSELVPSPFALIMMATIVWLVMRRPAPRERCPGCGKLRRVSRITCSHCAARWTAVATRG